MTLCCHREIKFVTKVYEREPVPRCSLWEGVTHSANLLLSRNSDTEPSNFNREFAQSILAQKSMKRRQKLHEQNNKGDKIWLPYSLLYTHIFFTSLCIRLVSDFQRFYSQLGDNIYKLTIKISLVIKIWSHKDMDSK